MKRIVILFLGLLILLGGNCTKYPTGPGSVRGPILYAISAKSSGFTEIFFIDTSTDSLIDSMSIPYAAYGRGVSPDGLILYLGSSDNVRGLEIDTKSKAIIYAGPETGVPTPDGKYLLGSEPFRVPEARTREVVYQDSLGLFVTGSGMPFDTKRGLVYGALWDDPNSLPRKIGVFDYRNLKLVDVIKPSEIGGYNIPVVDIAVTHFERKLYYTSYTGIGILTGIDLIRKRVVSLQALNGFPWLGIRPDDRYLYVTDAGGYGIEPEPSGKIGVYSPFLEKAIGSIDACQQTSLCNQLILACDQIVLTPDGKKAYVSTFGDSYILIIDTSRNEVIKVIKKLRLSGIRFLAIRPPQNFILNLGG